MIIVISILVLQVFRLLFLRMRFTFVRHLKNQFDGLCKRCSVFLSSCQEWHTDSFYLFWSFCRGRTKHRLHNVNVECQNSKRIKIPIKMGNARIARRVMDSIQYISVDPDRLHVFIPIQNTQLKDGPLSWFSIS